MLQTTHVILDPVTRAMRVFFVLALLCVLSTFDTASAADLNTYLSKVAPADFFAEADRFGPAQGDPPIIPVYRGDQLQG